MASCLALEPPHSHPAISEEGMDYEMEMAAEAEVEAEAEAKAEAEAESPTPSPYAWMSGIYETWLPWHVFLYGTQSHVRRPLSQFWSRRYQVLHEHYRETGSSHMQAGVDRVTPLLCRRMHLALDFLCTAARPQYMPLHTVSPMLFWLVLRLYYRCLRAGWMDEAIESTGIHQQFLALLYQIVQGLVLEHDRISKADLKQPEQVKAFLSLAGLPRQTVTDWHTVMSTTHWLPSENKEWVSMYMSITSALNWILLPLSDDPFVILSRILTQQKILPSWSRLWPAQTVLSTVTTPLIRPRIRQPHLLFPTPPQPRTLTITTLHTPTPWAEVLTSARNTPATSEALDQALAHWHERWRSAWHLQMARALNGPATSEVMQALVADVLTPKVHTLVQRYMNKG